MNIRYIYLLAGTGLFLGSCASQQQLAQVDRSDNVYYSEAKAIEKREPVRQYVDEAPVAQGSMDPNDAYYYDGDSYANRLDRFYSYSPWRSYYDPFWGGGGYDNWYGGGAYAFSPWASYYNPTYSYGLGLGIGLGFGSPWGYNNPYSYWGPNSYYNYYGAGYAAWGGGYYGMNGFPGYYGGGRVVSNENYRARPVRSGDGAGYINTGRPVGGRTGYVTDGRGNVVPMGRTRGGANMPIPSRGGDVDRSSARPVERPMPTRTQETPRESFPSRVERPSPSPAPSRVSGGGGGGGAPRGGGGGGGRPGRTGG